MSGPAGVRTGVTFQVPGNRSKVDNSGYSYGFAMCLGGEDKFAGARLTYKYSNAGD